MLMVKSSIAIISRFVFVGTDSQSLHKSGWFDTSITVHDERTTRTISITCLLSASNQRLMHVRGIEGLAMKRFYWQ